jgi:rod shape-determining protein MreD
MAVADPDLVARRRSARLWVVPVVSTIAGSCLGLLPFVVTAPTLPSFGLLMALGWRLLRPEMWAPWMALPLGLADDLIGGAPLGTAATLWTIAFLGFDIVDAQSMWRDYWLDWWLASIAILFCGVGDWLIVAFVAGRASPIWTILPTLAITVIAFPTAAWICTRLDRWRLKR